MAEAVLFNIAEGILGKLGSLAFQELALLVGVQGELSKLENTISTIRDVLLDAEEQYQKSHPTHQIRGWLAKLQDAVYEADDLLDEFSTEGLRRKAMAGNKVTKEVRLFFSSSNQLAFRHKMGDKIKKIRETLDAVAEDRTKFSLEVRNVESQVVARKRDQTHSYVREENVIGRENDKKAIINLLLDSKIEGNVLIIPIVGIGGLGKTTLAQLVYNDDKVKTNFEQKLWVCVSDDFDVKVIAEKIIECATNKKPDQNLEMNTLKNHLQDNINGKKYFLVLDDVWNEDREKWIGLEELLMGGAGGSRIIITTRSKRVAKITSRVSPYVLKGLPENESWSLFTQLAFEKGQELKNPSLVEIGGEIVKKCCGVPLAIRTIGSLLYSEESKDEWVSIKNSELSKITQEETSILPILKLSYDNLPSHLKHCFAYCRLFPKDHNIDVEMLINLWVGQGFVKSTNTSKCLKEIGLGYFKDLLWRSFFQEVVEDEFGNATSCKMHDLMHGLAVLVAGSESITLSSKAEIVHEKTRHILVDCNFDISSELPTTRLKANKLRTFIVIENGWSDSNFDAIVSKFKRLRVLDFGGLRIKRVPQSIGKLKYLRYLNLSRNEIEVLPSSITELQNLLSLNLNWCEKLKELPEDIDKLISLTILDIDECHSLTHMPHGLGQLTSLEKLPRFIVSIDHGGLKELHGLNNLRGELRLENLSLVKNADSEYKAANLKEKEHLQSLILEWRFFDIYVDAMSMDGFQPHKNLKELRVFQYPGVGSPSWLSFLTNLVNLELSTCQRVKHLPPLEGLTSLRDLSIKGLTDLEYIECDGSNSSRATFFSSLEKLKVVNCLNLKGWKIVSMETTETLPPFPCLSELKITSCPNLTLMPLFPSIEEELLLQNTSGKPLQQTMMMKSKSSSSSSPPLPLSKLKSLQIDLIHDLEYLPHQGIRNLTSLQSLKISSCNGLLSLAGEGFSRLISLRSLQIYYCQSLKSISGVFQHCTALEELKISGCAELDISDAIQYQGLRSLSSLTIMALPQLVSLPEGLQHVTTLKSLEISYCERLRTLSPIFEHLTTLEELKIESCNELDLSDVGIQFQDSRSLRLLHLARILKLVTLPEWLQHFTTLRELYIRYCTNLTSLPEGMRRLTSLQKLEIDGCPQLSERCGNNMGVDWPKIAHIPNIEIDEQRIQLEGCYRLQATKKISFSVDWSRLFGRL